MYKKIFKEKLYNINKDVDYIYNKSYKKTIENIFNKKITIEQLDKIIDKKIIVKSFELKSTDCIEANKIDPVIISCEYFNEEGAGYDSTSIDNLIIIDVNINVLYTIVQNDYEDIDYLEDQYKNNIYLFNNRPHKLLEFVEKNIKLKITHELIHWIDDVAHGRFLFKRQLKAEDIYKNKLLTKEVKEKLIDEIMNKGKPHRYMSDTEVNSLVHQVSKVKDEFNDLQWNKLSLEQVLSHAQIFHTFKSIRDKIGREKFYKFQKEFIARLGRENLLGKNMNKLVLIENIENWLCLKNNKTRN